MGHRVRFNIIFVEPPLMENDELVWDELVHTVSSDERLDKGMLPLCKVILSNPSRSLKSFIVNLD